MSDRVWAISELLIFGFFLLRFKPVILLGGLPCVTIHKKMA